MQSQCKECGRARSKAHYAANKQQHIKVVRRATKQYMERFYAWKAKQKCQLCPESHSGCLDFHHLDPTQKDFHPSRGLSATGRLKLVEELRKCAILCRNCHVKVHDGVVNTKLTAITLSDLDF